MGVLTAILLLIYACCTGGFNVDTKFPMIFRGPERSYFGYTVALHRNRVGPVVLVGAPKANSTTLRDSLYEPGGLFKCSLPSNESKKECEEIALMKEGNTRQENGEKLTYVHKKDKMWLGVSLDVQETSTSNQNDIVVCGHLWKNQRYPREYFVNGICYVINSDLNPNTVSVLLPLISKYEQYRSIYGSMEYNFAYGQAGISALFTQNGDGLILGAPGVMSWTGSFVKYDVNPIAGRKEYINPTVPYTENDVDFNSYFGYSISSGNFLDKVKEPLLAVGAPRDADNHGRVYLVTTTSRRIRVYLKKNGEQDLDKFTELAGERKTNARFGTSIANIGDINQDGYPDIAIGAPYEDKNGVVYIYHGAYFGLKSRYEQRIEASSLSSHLHGFGIHISRGLDIDENGYPDIVVGSYASSNAVLLRSRPIVSVYSQLNFIPKKIDRNLTCVISGSNRICVQVDACLQYTGVHVPTSLEFDCVLHVKDRSNRAFFEQSLKQRENNSFDVEIGVRKCLTFHMFLRRDIEDLITPIQVQFSHSLVPPVDFNYFNFPIYHPSIPNSITSDVYFETGCGHELNCFSNLVVSSELLDPPQRGVLILGTMSSISVSTTVRNAGEPAYKTQLLIYLPKDMPIINSDICEYGDQLQNASLACNLGNPLVNNTQVTINIKLDATKIRPHTKYLKITFVAITSSNETMVEDNVETLPLHLKTVSKISVIGTSSTEQVMYDGIDSTPSVITHTYIVRNHGPSPLKTIKFSLLVPYVLYTVDGPVSILSFTGLETDSRVPSAVSSTCNYEALKIQAVQVPKNHKSTSFADVLSIENEEKPSKLQAMSYVIVPPSDVMQNSDEISVDVPLKKETNGSTIMKDSEESKIPRTMISCGMENIQCIELLCSTSPFTKDKKFAEISVSFQMNFSNLDIYLVPWFHIELATNASISALDTEDAQQRGNLKVAQVTTVLLNKGVPPSEYVPMWIIFVSMGIGLLLLLVLLIIFVKIGFFKRKEKDKMKKMLLEKKKVENVHNADNNDTEELN